MRRYADMNVNPLISSSPSEFIPIMVEAFDATPMINDVIIKGLDGPPFLLVRAHATVVVVVFRLHTQNRFATSS